MDLPAQAPAVPGVAARSRTDLPQRLLPFPAGGPRSREPPPDPLPRLAQALQAEDRLEHRLDDDRLAVHVAAVTATAVETVLVAALEPLAEVVRVVGAADVAAAEAVAAIDPDARAAVVVAPAVVPVGATRAQAFLVAALHRGAQHVGTVVAGAVPAAAVVVAVRRARAVVAGVIGAALRGLAGLFGAQALLVGTLAGLLLGPGLLLRTQALLVGARAGLLLGDAGADLAVVLPCFAAVLAALLLGLAAVLAALLPGFAALLAALLALFLAVLAMLLPVLVAGGGRLGGHA